MTSLAFVYTSLTSPYVSVALPDTFPASLYTSPYSSLASPYTTLLQRLRFPGYVTPLRLTYFLISSCIHQIHVSSF